MGPKVSTIFVNYRSNIILCFILEMLQFIGHCLKPYIPDNFLSSLASADLLGTGTFLEVDCDSGCSIAGARWLGWLLVILMLLLLPLLDWFVLVEAVGPVKKKTCLVGIDILLQGCCTRFLCMYFNKVIFAAD